MTRHGKCCSDGRQESALLGVVLVLVGSGMWCGASIGFVHRHVLELPLGRYGGEFEEAAGDPWRGSLAGLVVVGVILAVAGCARGHQGKRRNYALKEVAVTEDELERPAGDRGRVGRREQRRDT